jgi:hypothetical protein
MELALGTFAPWFSTLTLQLIDRSFDHGFIRQTWLDKPFELISEANKGLPKATELLSVCAILYAHYIRNIQIYMEKARKKTMSPKKILCFPQGRW